MTAREIQAKMQKVSRNMTDAENSGKTKTAEKLRMQLKALGKQYVKVLALPGWKVNKGRKRTAVKKRAAVKKRNSLVWGEMKTPVKKISTAKKSTPQKAAGKSVPAARKNPRLKAKKNAATTWPGATWQPGKRPKSKKRRNSPTAAAVQKYVEFHGREPDAVRAFKSRVTLDDTVSGLGKLVLLDVIGMNGKRVELSGFKGAILAQDIDGTQLHIVGGDQSVDVEAFGVRGERRYEMLGLVELVAYHTTKDHLSEEDGGTADYHHEFGENGGALPCLMYDTVDSKLTFVGGDYRLLSVGIDD